MTKKQKAISKAILEKVADGIDVGIALDMVLGNETYYKMISDIYDRMNEKK